MDLFGEGHFGKEFVGVSINLLRGESAAARDVGHFEDAWSGGANENVVRGKLRVTEPSQE
jgi:hypothetical protein